MSEKKRGLALIVAAIACPCHVALLPALAAGTALGTMLEAHLGWFFAGATLVFLGALAFGFWGTPEPVSASCEDGRCEEVPTHRDPMDSSRHTREESWQVAAR